MDSMVYIYTALDHRKGVWADAGKNDSTISTAGTSWIELLALSWEIAQVGNTLKWCIHIRRFLHGCSVYIDHSGIVKLAVNDF